MAKTQSPYFAVLNDTGLEQFPLKSTEVDAQVNGVIASVRVRQVYRNQGVAPIHARYIFPGSTRAALHGMTMVIGERRIVAKIKEKEQAQKIFDTAKKQGKAASLLSQKRPNVFSMDVANIAPGDEVAIELEYTEILDAEDGVYEFVYPGVVGPRYGGDADRASDDSRWVSNPYLPQGRRDEMRYDIDVDISSSVPVNDLNSTSHAISSIWENAHSVRIALASPGEGASDQDFVLRYRLQGNGLLTGLSRFKLADEQYFMLLAEPPRRVQPADLPARDYLFIVDVSGSMHGFPLDTAKVLMSRLMHDLRVEDSFNILLFSGGSAVLAPEPLPATPSNIARATAMLATMQGGGGTELLPALSRALSMPLPEDKSRSIVVITDGFISAEREAFRQIDEQLGRSNLFAFGIGSSVNRHLIEGLAKVGRAEAFIVTDSRDAEAAGERFRDYISAPVLTSLRLQGRNVELYDVEPLLTEQQLPDLLAQRPVLVLGKYRNATDDAAIELSGVSGAGPRVWTFPLAEANADATLPRLWARKRLERLYVFPAAESERRAEILSLGLKYSILTSATSFVAVDDRVRPRVMTPARTVKQPLPLPAGVSNLAVGGELRPMPEPEMLALLGAGVLMLAVRRLLRRMMRERPHA